MFKLKLKKEKPPEKPISVVGLKRLNTKRRSRPSKRKLLITLGILLVVFLFLSIFFLIKKNPLKIENVVFRNADLSCASNEEIKNYLNFSKYNFISLNPEKLETHAKEHFVCLSAIQINKKFPSTIEISADDRKAAAVIKVFQVPQLDLNLEEATSSTEAAKIVDNTQNAALSGSFLVDDQGFVMNNADSSNSLPIIDYYNEGKEIKLGTKLSENSISKSLKAINGLAQQAIVIKNAKIVDDNLYLTGDNQYIFSLSKDLDHQLAVLQLILHQAEVDSKQVSKVDLRFDKAVVVYSGK